MSANGLVAVGCHESCVVVLDSNSNYSMKQRISGLRSHVRGHNLLYLLTVLGRQIVSPSLRTVLFWPSDVMMEPIMFMAIINQMVNTNNSLNKSNM